MYVSINLVLGVETASPSLQIELTCLLTVLQAELLTQPSTEALYCSPKRNKTEGYMKWCSNEWNCYYVFKKIKWCYMME